MQSPLIFFLWRFDTNSKSAKEGAELGGGFEKAALGGRILTTIEF